MPCVRGNQLSIEQRNEQRRQTREAKRAYLESPQYKYWHALVDRVCNQQGGFETLSHGDRLYYLINVLSGEVCSGGFCLFFTNSSGNQYKETVTALVEVEAQATLALLLKAKSVLFVDVDVPIDRAARYRLIEENPDDEAVTDALNKLDESFNEDPDNLTELLDRIASTHNLYKSQL